jgi:polyphosphate kinase 2 (PPK2 family)
MEQVPRRAARSSIFDRSWYNRAGVEYVMGFCSKQQHQRFLEHVPGLRESSSSRAVSSLIKIWLEVERGGAGAAVRGARSTIPLRQWKLSPMDMRVSDSRWFEYSRARDLMLDATLTPSYAPWHIVRSDDKKRARLNVLRHILDQIPHKKVQREKVKLPKRSMKGAYDDQATLEKRKFVRTVY